MKKMHCFVKVFVSLGLLYGSVSGKPSAQTVREGDSISLSEVIPMDSAIIAGRLDNGLTYFIRPNRKPENRAELRLVVNAGSVLEDDDQRGLAHFCEHMAFNGTRHFKKQALIDFLESIGMRFGPEINAYTSFDETVYMLEVPTDSASIVETAFLVLEDWAHGVLYEAEEIDRERGVIVEEWRGGRGAGARMRDEQLPVIFRGSRYAERLIIGKKEIIEGCDYESLRRYYRDWYRPNLMAVIAVGDFNPTRIEELIHAHFAHIPASDSPRERIEYPVPDHEETLFAIATDPEATRTSISVYYKYDLLPEKTATDYRRQLLEYVYDAMLNQRLSERAREADPPFLYGFAGKGQMVRTKGVAYLVAGVEETGLEWGLEAVLTEAERARRFGFTEPELERVKQAILRSIDSAYRERDKTESSVYAAEYTRHFLEDEPVPGIAYEFAFYNQFIPGIRLDEVNRLARERLTESNRVILVNAPEKEGLSVPTEDDLLDVFDVVAAKEIEPYEEEVSEAPLVAELPLPGKLVAEETIDELGITVWRFSNGIKFLFKPTDFQNDEIQFTSVSPGGHSLAPDSLYVSASMATALVGEGGLGPFSRIELSKKLAGKVVRVSPAIGSVNEGVWGSASPQDVETMFQLIYLTFTAPRRDSTAYLSLKTRLEGFIANRSAQPESAFGDTLQVTLAQHHFRARPISQAIIDELDYEASLDFYRDRYADAGDFTFVFVGNFTPDDLKPLVELYIGGLPAGGREERWRDVGISAPEGVIEKVVWRGIESKGHVRIVFPGEYTWSRWDSYRMDAMLDVLRIKLREVIREDLGGTYGVTVSGAMTRRPREEFRIHIDFGCDPERIEELTKTVFTQIDSLRMFAPDESYILKVKESQLRSYETNLKENSYWLSALRQLSFYGRDLTDILTYPDLVERLTPEDILWAAERYFNFDRYVRIVLLPEDEN